MPGTELLGQVHERLVSIRVSAGGAPCRSSEEEDKLDGFMYCREYTVVFLYAFDNLTHTLQ